MLQPEAKVFKAKIYEVTGKQISWINGSNAIICKVEIHWTREPLSYTGTKSHDSGNGRVHKKSNVQ